MVNNNTMKEFIEREGFDDRVKGVLLDVVSKLVDKMGYYIGLLNIEDSKLKEAIRHILGRGKFLRGVFSYIVGRSLGASEDDLLILAVSAELYHTASLIHDDIIDKAEFRRGVETVHRKYGLERAIVAGDALVIYPNYILAKLGGEVIRALAKAGIKLCDGEALELNYIRRLDEVDLDTYNDIAYKKTASFFEHLMEAVSIISDKKDLTDKLTRMGRYLGMAFQYRDDILDVIGDPKVMGKPIKIDLDKPNLVYVLVNKYGMKIEEAIRKAYDMIDNLIKKAVTIIGDLPINKEDKDILIILSMSLGKRVV
jgi:geranylgeranyl pyrophosphate synthase